MTNIPPPAEGLFNQKCAFGYLVEGHAVYCQSKDPKAPRKCRRTWATNGEIKDEDCPFFSPRDGAIQRSESILQSDKLPGVELYTKLLNTASIRYNMTLDECRSKFGLFTEKQWLDYLQNNP